MIANKKVPITISRSEIKVLTVIEEFPGVYVEDISIKLVIPLNTVSECLDLLCAKSLITYYEASSEYFIRLDNEGIPLLEITPEIYQIQRRTRMHITTYLT